MATNSMVDDRGIAQFLALAASANVYFELLNDRLIIRAVNARWDMWRPIRYLLDEVGQQNIEAYFRRTTQLQRQSWGGRANLPPNRAILAPQGQPRAGHLSPT